MARAPKPYRNDAYSFYILRSVISLRKNYYYLTWIEDKMPDKNSELVTC